MSDDADIAPFSVFVLEHRNGQFNAEVAGRLAEVVRKVEETGKKGTVSIKLTIEPVGHASGQVVIVDQVDNRPPRELTGSIWFTDANGGVSRRDPNQITFPDVDRETGEIRD
jgi:hypothetical protein